MKYSLRITYTCLLIVVLLMAAGCGGGSGNGSASVETGSAAVITKAAVPAGVTSICVVVNGSDFQKPIRKIFGNLQGTATFDPLLDPIPAGDNRTFSSYGLNSEKAVTHTAVLNNVTVLAGEIKPLGTLSWSRAAITNLKANVNTSCQVDLSWTDNSQIETGFVIKRMTGATGTWEQIASVPANVTSYRDTPLPSSEGYYYQVLAIFGDACATSYSDATQVVMVAVGRKIDIDGTVTSTGVGLPKVTVKLERTSSPAYIYPETTTDDYGGYSFKDLTVGDYTISVSKPGYSFTPSVYSFTIECSGALPFPSFDGTPVKPKAIISLPRTGQIASYADGDDGAQQKGVAWSPSTRFTDNGNGTVTDDLTGLIWLKNTNCFGFRTWSQALSDANTLVGNNSKCGLNDKSFAGQWRLPNRKELMSLIDRSHGTLPAGHPFTYNKILPNVHWSSSTYVGDTTKAFSLYMFNGHEEIVDKSYNGIVWPVRSISTTLPRTGQTTIYASGDDGAQQKGVAWSPSTRFTDNGNGTVTDNLTGLVWLQDANCFYKSSWENALIKVNSLAHGACRLNDKSTPGKWRLPNINELESLVDIDSFNPSLPVKHPFSGVRSEEYWSSTSLYTTFVIYGLVVDISTGIVSKSTTEYFYTKGVWPVRDGP